LPTHIPQLYPHLEYIPEKAPSQSGDINEVGLYGVMNDKPGAVAEVAEIIDLYNY